MRYEIELTELALNEFKKIRAFDQRRIVAEMKEQLAHQPTLKTRSRKLLEGVQPEFQFDPPLWELRIGDYRVFYDVKETDRRVYVRAIRKKLPGQTTKDVIHEKDDA